MPTLVIRNIDDDLHARLKASAKERGRSMEADVRARLRESLAAENPASGQTLGEAVRAVFGPLGGVHPRGRVAVEDHELGKQVGRCFVRMIDIR